MNSQEVLANNRGVFLPDSSDGSVGGLLSAETRVLATDPEATVLR